MRSLDRVNKRSQSTVTRMSFFKFSERCLVLIKFLTFSIYRHSLHRFPNPRHLQGSIEEIKHLCGQTNFISSTEHQFLGNTLLGHQGRIFYISYNTFLLYGVVSQEIYIGDVEVLIMDGSLGFGGDALEVYKLRWQFWTSWI
jgi:hypothetical protein